MNDRRPASVYPVAGGSACLACLAAWFLLSLPAAAQEAPPTPLRVLLITGGCCHDYTAQKQLLKKGLEARSHVEVTVVQQGGSTTDARIPLYEDPDWASGYDVVIHDECFAGVDDPQWVDRILKPHKEGVPAVVIHCAMHCYRDGRDEWFQFCGVTSRRHGAQYAHEVLRSDAEHPIMRNFPAAWANPAGELYWIEKVWPTAHPLATAKNREKGNDEVCVWTNDYHGTRVFGTTLGHHNETVSDPTFLDLITRGTLWAAGHLDEQYLKAPPGADEDDRSARSDILKKVKPPEGFRATVFAAPPAVQYPVFVAAAPDGTLYVSVDKNGSLDREPRRGAVYRLRDRDGDGRADEVKLFVADVDSPRGLVWDHDRLYLMHPPHLSAFIDEDGDGTADRQEILVKNIAFSLKDRPADHTSNGVTLGIDGWLYLAIGDFGFLEATGTDGRRLQLRGGGVVRVRPDGTGLELYAYGTRNILEVALDPLLNGFSRDNTNDGGGWDIHLHHFTGLEHHGYPSLFQRFSNEAVAPLADYGGGSGCGGVFIDEPGLPEGCSPALYTADWGRNWVYRHQLEPAGATFRPTQDEFLEITRVTDLDVDACSRLYVSSWEGATFTYNGEDVGYVIQLTPEGYTPEELPDFESASREELVRWLDSPSHRRRLEAQRALLRRGIDAAAIEQLQRVVTDAQKPLATRVAAMLALKQGLGSAADAMLTEFARDPALRALAIRALGDRYGVGVPWRPAASPSDSSPVPLEAIASGLRAPEPRARMEAAIAFARLQLIDIAAQLLPLLADPDPVVSHTAVRALIRMNASEACFVALDEAAAQDPVRRRALEVLGWLHNPDVVEGIILRLDRQADPERRMQLLDLLCRLYYREGAWDGTSWGTRPDTTGPYYKAETWDQSARIAGVLNRRLEAADPQEFQSLVETMDFYGIYLPEMVARLQALAVRDARWLPIAIRAAAHKGGFSESSLEMLQLAARSRHLAPRWRVRAVQGLLELQRSDAIPTAVEVAGDLSEIDEAREALQGLRERLLRPRLLEARIDWLCGQAGEDRPTARWALAGLMVLAHEDDVSAAARAQAEQVLQSAWQDAGRRREALEAVLLADRREYEPQVRAALQSSDRQVASAAQRIARRWKLNRAPSPGPFGKPIKEMPLEVVLEAAVSGAGEVARGAALFTRLECTKCHTTDSSEPLRGPFLPQVARTYDRRQLAESILLPSKSIAQGFATEVFLLDSGRTLTGFVTKEAADQVVLRDQEGKEWTLEADEVEQRARLETSIMPDGLAAELTVGQLGDLLSYLESLAASAQGS